MNALALVFAAFCMISGVYAQDDVCHPTPNEVCLATTSTHPRGRGLFPVAR